MGGVADDLTDREWERLEPLLPSMDPQRGGRWHGHRQVINGILWRTENSAKWHQVPDRYGPLEDGLPPVLAVGTGRHVAPYRA